MYREEFILAKNAAVKKLVSINGIGPEREFEPFNTMPKKNSEVFVGMTKYASQGKVYRAMFSFGFISKLMKFMKKMDAIAGVFIQPTDETFDYLSFSTHQNITEIALLRPKKGIDQETFLKAKIPFHTLQFTRTKKRLTILWKGRLSCLMYKSSLKYSMQKLSAFAKQLNNF